MLFVFASIFLIFPIFVNLESVDKVLLPLQLTPFLESKDILKAQALASVTHPKFLGVASYSGYFTVNESTDANLFFWYFPAQWDQWNSPVILWLQGGPGVSSLYGLFTELGPYEIVSETELKLRKFSWHKRFNLLFIDNPVGTGYSYTNDNGYLNDQDRIGQQLYNGVSQFFELFPELQSTRFYVAGESYAGKYVPALGHAIYRNNPRAKVKINLQGLIIGNGLTDPINQINYSDYLYQLGLIDEIDKIRIGKEENTCIQFLKEGNWTIGKKLMHRIYGLVISTTGMNNMYNFLIPTDLSPEESYMQAFLNSIEIKAALHVANTTFEKVAYNVYDSLSDDSVKSVSPWIAELLGHYRTLIYHGQLDIIVPYKLADNYLSKLHFDAAEAFATAERRKWFVDGDLAGYYKTAGNLTEVLVRNAGHMVPTDQPKWAMDLITKFVNRVDLS